MTKTGQSVIVDLTFRMPAFAVPSFNTMVIYELHIGTFNNTFAGAVEKLDYLKNLGINAVEVLPITQNPLFADHIRPITIGAMTRSSSSR